MRLLRFLLMFTSLFTGMNQVSAEITVFNDGDSLNAIDLNNNFDELSKAITPPVGLGESSANAALNCLDLKTKRPDVPDGAYWVKPVSAKSAFRIYCDMTTDGGGWSLVWSNLRGGRGKVVTELQWLAAINTAPRYRGDPSADLESFEVFVGLKFWLELAPGTQKLLRYDWASDYQISLDQSYTCPFTLDPADFYRIDFVTADCVQSIGTNNPPALVAGHNNMKFTSYDNDNDISATLNCGAIYSNTPWWYSDCWSGNINGGGEFSSEGYFNGAYWTATHRQWGAPDGLGAGNGWIFVR